MSLNPDVFVGTRESPTNIAITAGVKKGVAVQYENIASNVEQSESKLAQMKMMLIAIKMRVQEAVRNLVDPHGKKRRDKEKALNQTSEEAQLAQDLAISEAAAHAEGALRVFRKDENLIPKNQERPAGNSVLRHLSKSITEEDLANSSDAAKAIVAKLVVRAAEGRLQDLLNQREGNSVTNGLAWDELHRLRTENLMLFRKAKHAIIDAAIEEGIEKSRIEAFRKKAGKPPPSDRKLYRDEDDAGGGGDDDTPADGEGGGDGDGDDGGDSGGGGEAGGGGGERGGGGSRESGESESDGEPTPRGRPTLEAINKSLRGGEYQYLQRRFYGDTQNEKLLQVLDNPVLFTDYIKGPGGLREQMRGKAEDSCRSLGLELTDENINHELDIIVSDEFSRRIANLAGRLHEDIDKSATKEFWEEEARRGGMFDNADVLFAWMTTSLSIIGKQARYAEGLNFYIKKQDRYDVWAPSQPFSEAGHHGAHHGPALPEHYDRETERISEAFLLNVPAQSFDQYIQAVKDRMNTQIQVRKALHNAVALIQSPPQEGGYFRALEGYIGRFLPSGVLDKLGDQPDSDEMFAASALEDKFTEAEFAKHNWIWQEDMNMEHHSLKLPERSVEVVDYLRKAVGWTGEEDEWRALRAIRMALGDAHAISLRAFEYGARASAPREPRGGSKNMPTSYGTRDFQPYLAFNPQMHYNLRFSDDDTLMGNLLFLPVEGKDLGKKMFWNHKDLMDEMRKSMEEYQRGRSPEDLENGTVRMIDWLNPAGTGSIYTRGGWRSWHAYESYVDTRSTHVSLTESWKAVESLGIEIMKDLVTNRVEGADAINGHFFESGGIADRRELVTYLAKKYFKMDDAGGAAMFAELEGDQKALSSNYKRFLFRALSRAVHQRIPTKFLRFEANRDVTGRQRGWDEIKARVSDSLIVTDRDVSLRGRPEAIGDQYERGVRSIATAEVKLRMETTQKLREVYERVKRSGRPLYMMTPTERADIERVSAGYELTGEKLDRYLEQIHPDRSDDPPEMRERARIERANARIVYDEINAWVNRTDEVIGQEKNGALKTGHYLDAFAGRYQNGFAFALATEELERTLIAHTATGSRTPERALNDIANSEENVSAAFLNYFELMKSISTGHDKDIHPLLEQLHKAHKQLRPDVGEELANKFVHHMSAMTLRFFLKDTAARGLVQSLVTHGKRNSLAAEFAGEYRDVWEWDINEANAWVNALEAERLLPKHATEVWNVHYEDKEIGFTIPLINKRISFGSMKVAREEFGGWSGDKLRKEFGVTSKQITLEILNKYVPLILLYLAYKFSKDAIEENEE